MNVQFIPITSNVKKIFYFFLIFVHNPHRIGTASQWRHSNKDAGTNA